MIGDPGARTNVVELFEHSARRRDAAPAIVGHDGQVHWSFADLAAAAARLAGALAALGIGPGDRVLILEPDPRRRYAVLGGVLWAGATITIPPAALAPWQAVAAAATPMPRAVIFGARLWPIVVAHPALRRLSLRLVTTGPRLPGSVILEGVGATPIDPVRVPDGAGALASYTTGSTGQPRLVLRSHGVLRAQHDALERLRELSDEDRDLVGLPMLVLHNLGLGVTSILPPPTGSARYGMDLRGSIERTHPTTAVGFPHLFEAAVAAGATGLRDLRAVHVGGSRVTRDLVLALRSRAPSARQTVVYGSTEIEPIAAIGAGEYLDALAASAPGSGVCVGHPVAGLELRTEPLPDGAAGVRGHPVGSLHIRGPHAAADAEAAGGNAAGSDAAGWVATGDAGWTDGGGRLWLHGRAANAVGRLFPFEVELAVEHLEWVRRAALIRLDVLGAAQAVVAVEPCDGTPLTRLECVRAIGALASSRRWPIAGVIIRRRLPVVRGPSAKVDTRSLARATAAPLTGLS